MRVGNLFIQLFKCCFLRSGRFAILFDKLGKFPVGISEPLLGFRGVLYGCLFFFEFFDFILNRCNHLLVVFRPNFVALQFGHFRLHSLYALVYVRNGRLLFAFEKFNLLFLCRYRFLTLFGFFCKPDSSNLSLFFLLMQQRVGFLQTFYERIYISTTITNLIHFRIKFFHIAIHTANLTLNICKSFTRFRRCTFHSAINGFYIPYTLTGSYVANIHCLTNGHDFPSQLGGMLFHVAEPLVQSANGLFVLNPLWIGFVADDTVFLPEQFDGFLDTLDGELAVLRLCLLSVVDDLCLFVHGGIVLPDSLLLTI